MTSVETRTGWPGLGFDPAPGDVAGTAGLADRLTATAAKLRQTHDVLSTVRAQGGSWTGEASRAFAGRLEALPRYLQDAQTSLRRAGDALGEWRGTLGGLQSRARDLEFRAAAARGELTSAEQAEYQARANPDLGLTAVRFSAAELPAAQQRVDAAQAAVERAVTAAAGLRASLEDLLRRAEALGTEHQAGARSAAEAVRRADDGLAPPDPSWFEQAAEWLGDNLGTIGDIAGIISGVAGALALVPVLTPVAGPVALVAGGVALLADGADMIVNEKYGDPGAWAGLAGDAAGLLPGAKVLGAAAEGVSTSLNTTVGISDAISAGWQAGRGALPGVIDGMADASRLGTKIGDSLGDGINGLLSRAGIATRVDVGLMAKGIDAAVGVVPQMPTVESLATGENRDAEKVAADGAGVAYTGSNDILDRIARRAAAAAS